MHLQQASKRRKRKKREGMVEAERRCGIISLGANRKRHGCGAKRGVEGEIGGERKAWVWRGVVDMGMWGGGNGWRAWACGNGWKYCVWGG